MRYDLAQLPITSLLQPITAATAALARLDERILHSDIKAGWLERCDFADAVASLWVDGELVHLEDLVLHDCGMGIRAPTHELTIAHDVLRTRRRLMSHPADWALSPQGLQSLTAGGGEWERAPEVKAAATDRPEAAAEPDMDPLAAELAAMDAVLARAEALLSGTLSPRMAPESRDPLLEELVKFAGYRPNALLTMARKPGLVPAVLQLLRGTLRGPGLLCEQMRFLIAAEAARGAQCSYTTTHLVHVAHHLGASWQKLTALPNYLSDPQYTDRERKALAIASAGATLPIREPAAAMAAAKSIFSDEEIVEVVSCIAMTGYFNRWNGLMASTLEPVPSEALVHVPWLGSLAV